MKYNMILSFILSAGILFGIQPLQATQPAVSKIATTLSKQVPHLGKSVWNYKGEILFLLAFDMLFYKLFLQNGNTPPAGGRGEGPILCAICDMMSKASAPAA